MADPAVGQTGGQEAPQRTGAARRWRHGCRVRGGGAEAQAGGALRQLGRLVSALLQAPAQVQLGRATGLAGLRARPVDTVRHAVECVFGTALAICRLAGSVQESQQVVLDEPFRTLQLIYPWGL